MTSVLRSFLLSVPFLVSWLVVEGGQGKGYAVTPGCLVGSVGYLCMYGIHPGLFPDLSDM